jgi:hypothetical protein
VEETDDERVSSEVIERTACARAAVLSEIACSALAVETVVMLFERVLLQIWLTGLIPENEAKVRGQDNEAEVRQRRLGGHGPELK